MDLSNNVISPLNNLSEVGQIMSEPDAPASIGNVVKINKCAPTSCNSKPSSCKPVECEKCRCHDTCCTYTLCTNTETDCKYKYNCGEGNCTCNSRSSCAEDAVCASNYNNFVNDLTIFVHKLFSCQDKK